MMYPSLSKSYLDKIVRFRESLQIKGKFKFGVQVTVEYLEKAVYELF